MFADDTNLFFINQDIRYLFQIVNQELEDINQRFISNKPSLNIYREYQKKFDQNLDFNFLRYVQRVTFKLCNLVHTNIIESLANF